MEILPGCRAMKFLTEPEVAELLRCSTTKIKRLRLKGVLAYYPGRPVLIAEADLLAYLDELRRNTRPSPPPEEEKKVSVEDARRWVLNAKLRRSWRSRPR